MSADTPLEAWIEERKRIHAAATEGPWETSQAADEESTTWIEAGNSDVLVHDTRGQGHMREELAWMKRVDADSIADAHNHLPALIRGWEAVLGLHAPWPIYEMAEMCESTDEEHQDARHGEAEDGALLCEDLPTGDTCCRECREDDGSEVSYPCPTVRALEAVIGDGE